jgi:hypothetical protein
MCYLERLNTASSHCSSWVCSHSRYFQKWVSAEVTHMCKYVCIQIYIHTYIHIGIICSSSVSCTRNCLNCLAGTPRNCKHARKLLLLRNCWFLRILTTGESCTVCLIRYPVGQFALPILTLFSIRIAKTKYEGAFG